VGSAEKRVVICEGCAVCGALRLQAGFNNLPGRQIPAAFTTVFVRGYVLAFLRLGSHDSSNALKHNEGA
jgi:hypothetical protein